MKPDLDQIQRRLEASFSGGVSGLGPASSRADSEPLELEAPALALLFRELSSAPRTAQTAEPQLHAAIAEVGHNLQRLESSRAKGQNPPFAYAAWLFRVCETLRAVQAALAARASRPGIKAAHVERPLAKLSVPNPPFRGAPRLQGFAVAPLLELAARETEVLSRRRRLLEAARDALLTCSASLKLPGPEIEARASEITSRIQEITAWQLAGTDADEALTHQLRRATHARDERRAEALLAIVGQLRFAALEPDERVQRVQALRTGLGERAHVDTTRPSLEQVSERTFGATLAAAFLKSRADSGENADSTFRVSSELVQGAAAADACFELGRSVAPVRVVEEQRRMAEVPFPTQTLSLSTARTVADLAASLITDPRLLVRQLASGSLLTRRYLAERKQLRRGIGRHVEARYYLLDGSASMSSRRGRMRDAVLLAELGMMVRHLEVGSARARPVVYYRYFSKAAEPAVKVETIEQALATVETVLARKSRGETDIQTALLESFQQIAVERGRDPNLQRAHIVLVTDGVAPVDLGAVWRARESLAGLPIGVSIVAIGAENEALKSLAGTQRLRGEPVFYHYVSDFGIAELMSRTKIAKPAPLSSAKVDPAAAGAGPVAAEPDAAQEGPKDADMPALWRKLELLVDELSVLRVPPDIDAIEQASFVARAYDEIGVSLSERGFEAERARCEALRRDARALEARFDRWFVDPEALCPTGPVPPAELLEVIEIVLLSVSELTDYLSSSRLGRYVDAIELLEGLLLEAGVAPWSYLRALPHATPRSRDALRHLRALR